MLIEQQVVMVSFQASYQSEAAVAADMDAGTVNPQALSMDHPQGLVNDVHMGVNNPQTPVNPQTGVSDAQMFATPQTLASTPTTLVNTPQMFANPQTAGINDTQTFANPQAVGNQAASMAHSQALFNAMAGFSTPQANMNPQAPVGFHGHGMDNQGQGMTGYTGVNNNINQGGQYVNNTAFTGGGSNNYDNNHQAGLPTAANGLADAAQDTGTDEPLIKLEELIYGPFEQPEEGAMLTRSTFYVHARLTTKEGGADSGVAGEMYVEKLQPLLKTQKHPIVLIHGDYHTGQVWNTKPDGKPGWASYFVYQGFLVYIVDLPACGRSPFTWNGQPYLAARANTLDTGVVERDLTAPAGQTYESWPTAKFHDKWPGNGKRGDPIFDAYFASLGPLPLRRAERQGLSQHALGNLLQRIGKAVLLGEGTGATMAWLAADAHPQLVAGVVAIEPAGPPAGSAMRLGSDGVRRYSSLINFDPALRQYGVADIPLTYEPPLGGAAAGSSGGGASNNDNSNTSSGKLDVHPQTSTDANGQSRTCMMQRLRSENRDEDDKTGGANRTTGPRQLVNLRQVPHAIVTAQASSHSTYDWATVQFLRQAGADVLHLQLEDYSILGNGHLMFLETNSDRVASLVMS